MMRRLLLLVLVADVALADPVLKHAGTRLGPVVSLDCAADGGITCARTATTGTGKLYCSAASATELGCVSTGTQTMAGAKTLTGMLVVDAGVVAINLRSIGTTHAHTFACAAGYAGAWENCTTHSEIERCNGTAWAQLDATPPVLLSSSGTLGEMWTTGHGITTFQTDRDVSVTHLAGAWFAGTDGGLDAGWGTNYNLRSYSTWSDGGTCSCNFSCIGATGTVPITGASGGNTGACSDAGYFCAMPCTGQCDFGKNEIVVGSVSLGCIGHQPTSYGFQVFGTVGSSSN